MNTEVEDIKARLSVKEVIGGYVQLTKAGTSWKGLCPFHHEKSPSFIVNEDRASWHCFGCNKGGDIFSFVMEMDGLSFPEALSLFAERAGVVLEKRGRQFSSSGTEFFNGEIHTEEVARSGISKEKILAILELSSKFFEKQLWDGEGKKVALPYLRDRGISDEFIRAFRLGYALSGWRTLSDFLVSKNFSPSEMEATGMVIRKLKTDNSQLTTDNVQHVAFNERQAFDAPLSKTESRQLAVGMYDRFRDRVTFPIFDTAGRVIGFSARVLPGADPPAGGLAKYINTPETLVYHKSRALYGMFLARRAIRDKGYALFVEGNMDVLAMHQAGYANTVAVSGTALTEEQLRIIKRYTEVIRLFFDMDSAGQKAARKSTELALSLGFSVSIVSLPLGKDAAEMARENIKTLHEAVSNSMSAPEYFLQASLKEYDPKTAEGKRHIAEDMLGLFRLLPGKIERLHWVHRLSDAIETKEALLLLMLKDMESSPVSLQERSSGSDEFSPHESTSKNQVAFEMHSEKLGKDVVAILLAVPALLPIVLDGAPKRVFDFVSKSPMLSFLAGETSETFLFARLPEEMKGDAAELAFLGEKLLGISGGEMNVDIEKARVFFLTTWKHFAEALRKEEMESLEHAMRVARERGDMAEERRLAGELVRVGGEKNLL